MILKYIRKVIKRKATAQISCPPAPPVVFEKSFADVSLLAGLLIDKFAYHLPLYRQHQRLAHAGITLDRGTLTQWVHRTADLLTPIYHALLSSVLQSHILTMDETPSRRGTRARANCRPVTSGPSMAIRTKSPFPLPRRGQSGWSGTSWTVSVEPYSPMATRSMIA